MYKYIYSKIYTKLFFVKKTRVDFCRLAQKGQKVEG